MSSMVVSKVNIPTILVIFGATGDLVRKKIVPALFSLYQKGELPSQFKIVGFSRRDWKDARYREFVADILASHHIKGEKVALFLNLFFYAKGDFKDKDAYKNLSGNLQEIDSAWGICTNKLFYLSVSPEFYQSILNNLSASGLAKPCSPEKGWSRIIVEKPFGIDAKTARSLDELLGKLFQEVQIYRIDHYLAKGMLQNILAFRFSNNLFEKNWSNETIEKIDIKLWETLGVEERGEFYDPIGALRDVGQNHLLQMLALVTMDLPNSFTTEKIREGRATVLRTLDIPSGVQVQARSIRGQYRGYRRVKGVLPNSKTETYFKIRGFFSSPRWSGIPVTVESGKRLGELKKEIVVTFRHPDLCFCGGKEAHQNQVVFSLEPEERIIIHFWAKRPGLKQQMEERTMEFLLRTQESKAQYVEEYEKLLRDCIEGDQTLFVSTQEIEAMWKFTDPFVREWAGKKIPLHFYDPDINVVTEMPLLEDIGRQSFKKEIGLIGLGKMGMNMAERLVRRGWTVVAFDLSEEKRKEAERMGVVTAVSIQALVGKLKLPRALWLMIPAKDPLIIDKTLFGKGGLETIMHKGDVIIDGGNSFYEDSSRRAKSLLKKEILFLDAGVSGGPDGARSGLSMMIGGDETAFRKLRYLFEDLSVPGGFAYFGKSGAGHFIKMVHNGIEYGMMQSIAEGFSVMQNSPFQFDLKKVARVYNRGSVISSRLMEWLERGFEQHGVALKDVSGFVAHSGEGEWTIQTAKKFKIPVKVIEESFRFRVRSAKRPSFMGKILTMLRNQFGGHNIK